MMKLALFLVVAVAVIAYAQPLEKEDKVASAASPLKEEQEKFDLFGMSRVRAAVDNAIGDNKELRSKMDRVRDALPLKDITKIDYKAKLKEIVDIMLE